MNKSFKLKFIFNTRPCVSLGTIAWTGYGLAFMFLCFTLEVNKV